MTMAESLVQGIDHVYVPLSEAESTYRVLTERFGLPVAWPYVASGDFASGAVNLGNLNFEVLAHSDAVPGFVASSPARIQGIAFHPVATSRCSISLTVGESATPRRRSFTGGNASHGRDVDEGDP